MQQTNNETEQIAITEKSVILLSNFTLQALYSYLLPTEGMRSVHCLYCLAALSGCQVTLNVKANPKKPSPDRQMFQQ